jgi:hypothetical protein
VDLDLTEAGKAALYSNIFLVALSMFYHSAIRVRLPWLDCIVLTPQVHRIHHAVNAAYHNRNFSDALPIFDIVSGTYHPPARDEFPESGLGPDFPTPRSFWSAQVGPLAVLARILLPQRGSIARNASNRRNVLSRLLRNAPSPIEQQSDAQ